MSDYVDMFTWGYFTRFLAMGTFSSSSYFPVITPHFGVLSWAYSTANVLTYGRTFLCNLFPYINTTIWYIIQLRRVHFARMYLLCAWIMSVH